MIGGGKGILRTVCGCTLAVLSSSQSSTHTHAAVSPCGPAEPGLRNQPLHLPNRPASPPSLDREHDGSPRLRSNKEGRRSPSADDLPPPPPPQQQQQQQQQHLSGGSSDGRRQDQGHHHHHQHHQQQHNKHQQPPHPSPRALPSNGRPGSRGSRGVAQPSGGGVHQGASGSGGGSGGRTQGSEGRPSAAGAGSGGHGSGSLQGAAAGAAPAPSIADTAMHGGTGGVRGGGGDREQEGPPPRPKPPRTPFTFFSIEQRAHLVAQHSQVGMCHVPPL